MPARSHVVHVDEVPEREFGQGERFASRFRRLGGAAGNKRLGCTLYEVEPGRRAFPFHAHLGIEEAIFVLEGTGTLRLGEEEHEVRPGSYAAFPVGLDHPHQLVNTGASTLRYLCFSSSSDPEVVVYPDSGKVAAMGWSDDGPYFRTMFMQDQVVGYWDGEETD